MISRVRHLTEGATQAPGVQSFLIILSRGQTFSLLSSWEKSNNPGALDRERESEHLIASHGDFRQYLLPLALLSLSHSEVLGLLCLNSNGLKMESSAWLCMEFPILTVAGIICTVLCCCCSVCWVGYCWSICFLAPRILVFCYCCLLFGFFYPRRFMPFKTYLCSYFEVSMRSKICFKMYVQHSLFNSTALVCSKLTNELTQFLDSSKVSKLAN